MNIIVKYRYTIPMPDRYKPYEEVLKDWSTSKFLSIYEGHTGLLVCPYFFVQGKEEILCQLLLDIEGNKSTHYAFNYSKELVNKYPFLSMEFTGKTGFHVVSNFLVKLRKEETPIIRHKMLDVLPMIDPIVDKTSSIRNMPTIRIGRVMKDRFAFPVNSNINFSEFEKLRYIKTFKEIMSQQDLLNYLKEFILPKRIISYKQYKNLF